MFLLTQQIIITISFLALHNLFILLFVVVISKYYCTKHRLVLAFSIIFR